MLILDSGSLFTMLSVSNELICPWNCVKVWKWEGGMSNNFYSRCGVCKLFPYPPHCSLLLFWYKGIDWLYSQKERVVAEWLHRVGSICLVGKPVNSLGPSVPVTINSSIDLRLPTSYTFILWFYFIVHYLVTGFQKFLKISDNLSSFQNRVA